VGISRVYLAVFTPLN